MDTVEWGPLRACSACTGMFLVTSMYQTTTTAGNLKRWDGVDQMGQLGVGQSNVGMHRSEAGNRLGWARSQYPLGLEGFRAMFWSHISWLFVLFYFATNPRCQT